MTRQGGGTEWKGYRQKQLRECSKGEGDGRRADTKGKGQWRGS